MIPQKQPTYFCAHQQDNDGFSLLELIVVCALIGIMLTLVAPQLRDTLFSDPLKSSVRKVIILTENAREQAVAEQRFCSLSFNSSNRQFITELHTTGDTKQPPTTKEINSFTVPESVIFDGIEPRNATASLQTDDAVMWIGPKGHIRPTAIHFSNTGGDQMSIHFAPFLIKATVYDIHTPLIEE